MITANFIISIVNLILNLAVLSIIASHLCSKDAYHYKIRISRVIEGIKHKCRPFNIYSNIIFFIFRKPVCFKCWKIHNDECNFYCPKCSEEKAKCQK